MPVSDTREALEEDPLYEAERLRIIFQLITNSTAEGGAGIVPKKGEWEDVQSLFPLHDHQYNKDWIRRWSTRWLLKSEELDEIRNRLGEKIAFYFAFTQHYFTFLLGPAAVGLFAWSYLGYFHPLYAAFIGVWSVIFVEYWKHKEEDLAIRWGVKGVSNIETHRPEFVPSQVTQDPVTGEKEATFSVTTRLQRQLLQVPFALAAALILGTIIATCFGTEVFINEVYKGPFKQYLSFLPTVLITTALPLTTGFLTTLARRLTDFENYETSSQYETALTLKLFVLNFITSYLGVFLTSFVYVPFGAVIVPYLDIFGVVAKPFAESDKQLQTPDHPSQFSINPARLRGQVFYVTVTAQVVNMMLEVVVPYLKRQGLLKVREIKAKRSSASTPLVTADDSPEEADFLARVRQEAELSNYDVYDDIREMVLQCGHLVLFSVIWPLAPVSFLLNNWVELRADAVKICVEMQRPTPWRADTIGPWLDALNFLTWIGSITMPALVYLFSNDGLGPDGEPSSIKAWGLLLTILLWEHSYLFTKWLVQTTISKLDSPGRQKLRRDRYLTRVKYFQESVDKTSALPIVSSSNTPITRQSLEDDAREGSLKTSTVEDRFWARQRGWQESARVGANYIQKAPVSGKSNSSSKKEL